MSSARTRSLESARRIAYVWKALWPAVRGNIRTVDATLAAELDALLVAVEAPEHDVTVRTETERGQAENGYQPESKYVWLCSCRPGQKSKDMGSAQETRIAVGVHLNDPTQFPGWLE